MRFVSTRASDARRELGAVGDAQSGEAAGSRRAGRGSNGPRLGGACKERTGQGMDAGLASALALAALLIAVVAMLITLWPCVGRMFLRCAVR